MSEYSDQQTVYRKSTPIAVKAALLYNHHIKRLKLQKKYREIGEGEKMKFIPLKNPNPFHNTVIGFPVSLPKEFGIEKYIDYKAQFETTFIEPLKKITEAIQWNYKKQNTLESLFD